MKLKSSPSHVASTTSELFDDEGIRGGLRARSLRGGVLTVASQVGMTACRLLSTVVLARLLDPADFGLLAMTAVVTGFVAMFANAGLSMATVQKAEISHEQISTLFWINTGMGFGLAVCMAACSPLIAWFYGEPRLVAVSAVLATTLMFSSLSVQHQALLSRRMRFGSLAAIGLSANLLGVAVGVSLALNDFGYWSLVAMVLCTELFTAVFTWIACPWRPGRPGRLREVREMLSFGGNLAAGSLVQYLSGFSDRLLIGRFFGPTSLGLYDRGWQLLMLPLRQINWPLTNVAVPMLSRLHNDSDRYRNAYLMGLSAILLLTTPIIASCIVFSDLIVELVLGPGWEEVAPLFLVLSVGAIAMPICNTTGWLFVSQGRTREQLRWQGIDAVLKVILVVVGLRWGTIGVAWACSIRLLLNPPGLFWYVGRRGPVSSGDLWSALSTAGASCALGCAAGISIRSSLALSSPFLMAPIAVLVSSLTCLLVLSILPSVRRVFSQVASPVGVFR